MSGTMSAATSRSADRRSAAGARGSRRGIRPLAALAAVLALGVLAGCAAQPDPVIDARQRAGIRAQLAGQAWQRSGLAEAQGDDVERPDVDPGPVVADHVWPSAISECMAQAGYAVEVRGTDVSYLSGPGDTLAAFELSRYECQVRTPRVGAVAVYLTVAQRGEIYDYYTRFVVPCLQLAGARTTTPPERGQFVDRFFAYEWHPFDAVWSTTPGDAHAAELEQQCPPVPPWLEL